MDIANGELCYPKLRDACAAPSVMLRLMKGTVLTDPTTHIVTTGPIASVAI